MRFLPGVVFETLAADVTGEQLDVGVSGDVVLQVVAGEKPLPTQFANVNPPLFSGAVLKQTVFRFLTGHLSTLPHPLYGQTSANRSKPGPSFQRLWQNATPISSERERERE